MYLLVIYVSLISLLFSNSNSLKNSKWSFAIETVNVLDWKEYYLNKSINFECNKSIEVCTKTYNPFTVNYCVVLTHFKTPVCGGLSCYFNEAKKKCDGQCSNTILQTCVSRVSKPTEDTDCICASSRILTSKTFSTCDLNSCYGNSCSLSYFIVNGISDGTIYGTCNNDY
jgi:hypothetical protein